jgi:hypothetical protein
MAAVCLAYNLHSIPAHITKGHVHKNDIQKTGVMVYSTNASVHNWKHSGKV